MSKPKFVYAGHSFHQLTSSTRFLLDLLEQHYQLSIVWDEGWQPSGKPLTASQINELNPEIVLFFQTLPAFDELEKIACRQLFLVPMHDYVIGHPQKMWTVVRSSGLRVLNFCRATHKIFLRLGYESRCVQYWPEPKAPLRHASDALNIFFWVRMRSIGWPLLRSLLGSIRPQRVILRVAPDPGQEIEMPSDADVRDYNIEVVTGWLEKSQYLELLTSCNIFVAPRLYEGIGQSYLEAMSYGLAVIAPNSPTMNEYIQHGRNGYLYDFAAPLPLDFSNVTKLCAQAASDVHSGHKAWQIQEQSILAYLASTPTKGAKLASWLRRILRR